MKSTDQISTQIGKRIDQMRLEGNLSQEELAQNANISVNTYKNLVRGKAKLETLIDVLKVLGRIDLIENMIPEIPISPLVLVEREGKKRKRASAKKSIESKIDLDW